MSLIKTNDYINKIVQISKAYFLSNFDKNIDNVKIYVSDNINEDTKCFIKIDTAMPTQNPNGRYIEPNDLTMYPIILINSKLNDCSLVSTILHELTHTSDYSKFVSEYCNNEWHYLRSNDLFNIMYYWSEYHARIIQIIHMRILISFLSPNDYKYNNDEIKEEMIKYQLPRYNQELINTIYTDSITMTDIFKYCARFYVCKLFNPELSIENEVPKQIYEYFPNIVDLYNELSSMQTYESASTNLEKMNYLLRFFL